MDFYMQIVIFTIAVLFRGILCNLPPVFSMDMNNLALSEKTPIGTVIYTLEGSDPENRTVHFRLEGTDALKVDPNTGDVMVVKPLDYETNDALNVTVSIEDEKDTQTGERENIVSVPVTIIILDENDNAPEFRNSFYNITVSEDTPTRTAIFSDIIIVDKDSPGEKIKVSCINLPEYPDACDTFDVETLSRGSKSFQGAIVLDKKLNYNEKPTIHFVLKATDGELSSTARVTINVFDIQDTPPRFKGAFEAEVKENAPINTLVMTISAEDGDKGMPRKVVYELVNNPMNYFLLDAVTGELRTSRPLDREAIDNKDGKVVLTIKACELIDGKKGNDESTTSTAEVTVKIIDVNDEPPSFDRREYFVEIPENIREGESIPGLDMTVTDPDQVSNEMST